MSEAGPSSSDSSASVPVARLVQGKVSQHLVRMTLPMIWALIAVIGFNVADTYFVAQLGTDELAAISFTFPIVLVVISLSVGFGSGAASVVARALGAGERGRAKQLTTAALLLAALVGLGLMAFGLAISDPLFRLLGAEERLLPLIHDYIDIWFVAIPFFLVPMCGNGCLRGAGDTRLPSMIMIFAALLNIVLNPLLIFGLWGFPRMEMEGAAVATLIARAAALAASISVLHFRERMIAWRLPALPTLLGCWAAVIHVGIPSAGTQMIKPIGLAVATALVASFGSVAVAGFGVATRLEAFFFVPIFALASVIGPVVGQNGGAGRYDRVAEAMRFSYLLCAIFGGGAALALALGGPFFAGLFNENPEVIEAAALYLWIVPVTYFFEGVVQNVTGAFNGLGKPGPAILIAGAKVFALYLPLAWLGEQVFGLTGIFAAAAIANLIGAAAAWWWMKRYCEARRSAG
ncbi:MAG: MATE family efflux transporter [Rhodovibrionaceae bacterium]